MSHHPSYPDTRIDQVLDALRTTKPPSGLESRIAAHIASRRLAIADSRASSTSYFAVILNAVKDPCIFFAEAPLYAFAATALTLLLTLSTLTLLHHRTPTTTIALTPASSPDLEGAALPSRRNAPVRNPASAAEGTSTRPHQASGPDAIALANTQAPQGFSLGSHNPTLLIPAPPDPDTIALAETRAPSLPAPPMPLTPQERLLQSATQRGAPIELAELDLAREPILRAAAAARDRAGLQQFAHSLVSQLVTSESLDPTSPVQSRDNTQPTPEPDPTSSSTNEPQTNGASQ